jgi:hypothetical protein
MSDPLSLSVMQGAAGNALDGGGLDQGAESNLLEVRGTVGPGSGSLYKRPDTKYNQKEGGF